MPPTEEEVREAFESPQDGSEGHEVLNVERNRSQYRVFLAGDVSRDDAEAVLAAAYGEGSVFGLDVTDERKEGRDEPARAVSFRLR